MITNATCGTYWLKSSSQPCLCDTSLLSKELKKRSYSKTSRSRPWWARSLKKTQTTRVLVQIPETWIRIKPCRRWNTSNSWWASLCLKNLPMKKRTATLGRWFKNQRIRKKTSATPKRTVVRVDMVRGSTKTVVPRRREGRRGSSYAAPPLCHRLPQLISCSVQNQKADLWVSSNYFFHII